MRWLVLTKLFFVAYLAMSYDDRLDEIGVCFLLTTLTSWMTGKTIRRIVNEREGLKTTSFYDLYVLMYLDLPYQWRALRPEAHAVASEDKKKS